MKFRIKIVYNYNNEQSRSQEKNAIDIYTKCSESIANLNNQNK